eukprot:2618716-Pyramimonas_sp.AAC.1
MDTSRGGADRGAGTAVGHCTHSFRIHCVRAETCKNKCPFAGWTPFAGWALFSRRMDLFERETISRGQMGSNVRQMGSLPAGWALSRQKGSNFAG